MTESKNNRTFDWALRFEKSAQANEDKATSVSTEPDIKPDIDPRLRTAMIEAARSMAQDLRDQLPQ